MLLTSRKDEDFFPQTLLISNLGYKLIITMSKIILGVNSYKVGLL